MVIGLLGLVLKLIEPMLVIKGSFGYDYVYEYSSILIPMLLTVIGFMVYQGNYRNVL